MTTPKPSQGDRTPGPHLVKVVASRSCDISDSTLTPLGHVMPSPSKRQSGV
jgi:hypothetical protein